MLRWLCSRDGEMERNSSNRHMPAFDMKVSRRPKCATVSATNLAPVSGSEMSPGHSRSGTLAIRVMFEEGSRSSIAVNASDQNERISCCSASLSDFKKLTATLAPWDRNTIAIARPIPVSPPVMAQTCPVNSGGNMARKHFR